jgi:hypothetical protein
VVSLRMLAQAPPRTSRTQAIQVRTPRAYHWLHTNVNGTLKYIPNTTLAPRSSS